MIVENVYTTNSSRKIPPYSPLVPSYFACHVLGLNLKQLTPNQDALVIKALEN